MPEIFTSSPFFIVPSPSAIFNVIVPSVALKDPDLTCRSAVLSNFPVRSDVFAFSANLLFN